MLQQSSLSTPPSNSLAKIQPHEVKKIVFNGGGAKGVAHPIAYAALLACGVESKNIDAVAGTSAGSIIATLVACGYDVDEMSQIMKDLDFASLLDEDGFNTRDKVLASVDKSVSGHSGFFSSLPAISKSPVIKQRVACEGGIYDGEVFRIFIEKLIAQKTGIPFCTFAELAHKAKQDSTFKCMTVVAYHHNTKMACFFNKTNAPDMIISDAVRASMAIPGFFKPHGRFHKVQNERVQVNVSDQFVDGGITDNFPVSCFDGTPSGDEIFNREVVGLMLTSSEKVAHLRGEGPMPYQEQLACSLFQFVQQNAEAALNKNYSDLVNSPKNLARTIPIDNKGVNTLDFHLKDKPELYNALMQAAWQAPCYYFGKTLSLPEKYCISLTSLPQNSRKP